MYCLELRLQATCLIWSVSLPLSGHRRQSGVRWTVWTEGQELLECRGICTFSNFSMEQKKEKWAIQENT
jgi:hypothetical protein